MRCLWNGEQVIPMVSFIQVPPRKYCDTATVRVGVLSFQVWYRLLFLCEPVEQDDVQGQLSLREGLLEFNNPHHPYIMVLISKHLKHEIMLPKRKIFGTV